jgi:hypothetical protein
MILMLHVASLPSKKKENPSQQKKENDSKNWWKDIGNRQRILDFSIQSTIITT